MSLYIDCIIRASACRTATSRPLASHSQAWEAGAWQIAQSGSILITPLRDALVAAAAVVVVVVV
jgi:hypothetical protein